MNEDGSVRETLRRVISDIDDVLGEGYAREHPELIVGIVQMLWAAASAANKVGTLLQDALGQRDSSQLSKLLGKSPDYEN